MANWQNWYHKILSFNQITQPVIYKNAKINSTHQLTDADTGSPSAWFSFRKGNNKQRQQSKPPVRAVGVSIHNVYKYWSLRVLYHNTYG